MNPNDLGKNSLIHGYNKISIKALTDNVNNRLKEQLLKSEIEMNGYNINLLTSKTGFGGKRYWFECPTCKRRVGVIYQRNESTTGCRTCLQIKYPSNRFQRMLEGKLINANK